MDRSCIRCPHCSKHFILCSTNKTTSSSSLEHGKFLGDKQRYQRDFNVDRPPDPKSSTSQSSNVKILAKTTLTLRRRSS